jgi:segregation and condensation protein A
MEEILTLTFNSIKVQFCVNGGKTVYAVKLEVFEGPLDLLLHLVDKNKLDITEVSLAVIAGEYESYIHQLRGMNLEVESSFITVFASLLQIKSKSLLPVPPKDEEDEEPTEHELVAKLREYRQFKEASLKMENLKIQMESSYPRPDIGKNEKDEKAEEQSGEPVLATQITREDLMDIYVAVMRKFNNRPTHSAIELTREQVSLPLILRMISKRIRRQMSTSLVDLFDSPPDRVEFIVTFLALLEMARQRKISLVQDSGDSKVIIINRALARNLQMPGEEKLAG